MSFLSVLNRHTSRDPSFDGGSDKDTKEWLQCKGKKYTVAGLFFILFIECYKTYALLICNPIRWYWARGGTVSIHWPMCGGGVFLVRGWAEAGGWAGLEGLPHLLEVRGWSSGVLHLFVPSFHARYSTHLLFITKYFPKCSLSPHQLNCCHVTLPSWCWCKKLIYFIWIQAAHLSYIIGVAG